MALEKPDWLKNLPKNLPEIRQYINDPKNRTVVLGACGVIILLMAVLFYRTHSMKSGKETPEGLTEQERQNAKTLDFLPEKERTIDASSENGDDEKRPRDPFASAMVLKGVIVGGGGSNQAIIEINKTVFVVSPGTKIGDTWTVEDIWQDGVLLQSANKELKLNFTGRQISAVEHKESSSANDGKSQTDKNSTAGKSDKSASGNEKTQGGDR
ncbi:hypothetical protein H1S01_10545 [Heliobacterium chlorum]|uniref:Type II secretion system protein GspC N-terminal domain-containing protein n=1 Tax=Heliobacterium chlorum TaxID=2698 RepID=A0ABR7T2F3_HELCL|nr:hypothetical protein [Heliobacterium chlorum]MBC9784949.1 hypothetical protein [Heliobacterium chlorum]